MTMPIASSDNAIELYLNLLLDFRALPLAKRNKTFMEISGYPHYENVSSNILGFLFDPSAEHGLKDLLLTSLLLMINNDSEEVAPLGDVTISREYPTEKGRLDLLIESESYVIGIENKIYHWLANDLEDYAQVVDRLGSGKQVKKIVLGLKQVQDQNALKGGFESYAYSNLWAKVRMLLGDYIAQANPKWVTYLVDFMETITNLAGENMELKQTDQFFIEHNDAIEKMLAERNGFLWRLQKKASDLCAVVNDTNTIKEFIAKSLLIKDPWIYSKTCLVLDLALSNSHKIAFDLWIKPTGWELQVFGRDVPSHSYLHRLIKNPVLANAHNAPIKDKRYILKTWNLQADLGEIRDALCALIEDIATADNSESAVGSLE